MRICGFAGECVRGEREVHETLPTKELHVYWSNHPRYEDDGSSALASGSTQGGYTVEPEKWEKFGGGEEPPPPYNPEEFTNLSTEKVRRTFHIAHVTG